MAEALGFTGSQKIPSFPQAQALVEVLVEATERVLHHGDCVGSDAIAHLLARAAGYRIVLHPPDATQKRAFCRADEVWEPRPYLIRNHDIVNETSRLVAVVEGAEESYPRSGAWATVRYARLWRRPITIVWPDGRVEPPVT
jgi:hypothetical protein